jgi:hypothetical protein
MSYRFADQKFGVFAERFLKKAQQQMGVHIFMMIGYKNEKGVMLRSKWVLLSVACHPLLTFHTFYQIRDS